MTDTVQRSNDASFYQRNWRWFVLGTLFLATFLNYFDRQTLGAAMPPIAEEFGFDEATRRVAGCFCVRLRAFATNHRVHIVLIFVRPRWYRIE